MSAYGIQEANIFPTSASRWFHAHLDLFLTLAIERYLTLDTVFPGIYLYLVLFGSLTKITITSVKAPYLVSSNYE